MSVELHERLSEFSYGYGVTREFERDLQSRGLSATPFLPSLLQEAKLGFDVGFKRAGTPLLLQFKLGQAMRRFVPGPRPSLSQTFWRYRIDTAEPDGQFELLLKAQQDGAAVFYFAPKFHDWEIYLESFERSQVVQRSLVVSPGRIRKIMDDNGVPDGDHKIVYDKSKAYLCSDPLELDTVDSLELADRVRAHIENDRPTIGAVLRHVYRGFSRRHEIRRPRDVQSGEEPDRTLFDIPSEQGRQPRLRQERLIRLLASGRSQEEAVALAVGAEAWASGAQLIFVTDPTPG
jgi:hypothetical protein